MTVAELVAEIRAKTEDYTPEMRLDLWYSIREGYCSHCGIKIPEGGKCYCLAED